MIQPGELFYCVDSQDRTLNCPERLRLVIRTNPGIREIAKRFFDGQFMLRGFRAVIY
jgi:hypothetical protein